MLGALLQTQWDMLDSLCGSLRGQRVEATDVFYIRSRQSVILPRGRECVRLTASLPPSLVNPVCVLMVLSSEGAASTPKIPTVVQITAEKALLECQTQP